MSNEQREQAIAAAKEKSAQAFRDYGVQAIKSYFGSKYEGIISNETGNNNPLALAIDRRNAIDGFILTTNGARAYCSKVSFKAYDPKSRQFKVRYSRGNGLPTEYWKLANTDVNAKADYIVQIVTGDDTEIAIVAIISVKDFLYACRRGYADIESYEDYTRSINVPFTSVRDCKSFRTITVMKEIQSDLANKEEIK